MAGVFAYPILLLFGFRHLVLGDFPLAALGLELHLATYAICLSFLTVWIAPERLEILTHAIAISVELLLILAIRRWRRMPGPWLAPCLALVVGGGLWVGLLLWSERMPSHITAAAAAGAEGQPWCIPAAGRRATSPRDLTALAVYDRPQFPLDRNFHALLAVGGPGARRYYNWSFRRDGFEVISADALATLDVFQGRGPAFDPCPVPARGGESAPPL
ncbi:hypothetical protein [Siccirubricoccus phaeus]|uniref:hypothetical protein n=1 Tax=Siccirubricoccus phaeus TaxID=2595053 RepID=UPI0011F25CEB|nr:hypothetical protein [Siccirubricoccus phaeus]